MKDEIAGKLIKPSNGQTLHYLLTEEYWDWQKEVFKKYIGKDVRITVEELEPWSPQYGDSKAGV